MRNLFSKALILITLICISCEKDCNCDLVVSESNFETNHEWTETSRGPSEECAADTLSSTFIDNDGNISYVRSIIQCE
jgi:hypothetical protein